MAGDIGSDMLSKVGRSIVPRTDWMIFKKTRVNCSGSFCLIAGLLDFDVGSPLYVFKIFVLTQQQMFEGSLSAPQHGHISVPRLHLYQLWPTGSQQNII